MIIPFINLCFFTAYASPARRKLHIAALTLLVLGAAWAVPIGLFLGGAADAGLALGVVICVCSVSFFVSPMHALWGAWRDRDTSRVPLLLSCVQVAQSVIWVIAGALLGDPFILGVNCAGLASGTLQIATFFFIKLQKGGGGGGGGALAGADAGTASAASSEPAAVVAAAPPPLPAP